MSLIGAIQAVGPGAQRAVTGDAGIVHVLRERVADAELQALGKAAAERHQEAVVVRSIVAFEIVDGAVAWIRAEEIVGKRLVGCEIDVLRPKTRSVSDRDAILCLRQMPTQ